MTSRSEKAPHKPRKRHAMSKINKQIADLTMTVETNYQNLSLLAEHLVKVAKKLHYTLDPRVMALAKIHRTSQQHFSKRAKDLSMSVETVSQMLSLVAKEVVKISNKLGHTVDPKVIALANEYDITLPTSKMLARLDAEIWRNQKAVAS
jgi:hypothetical protein